MLNKKEQKNQHPYLQNNEKRHKDKPKKPTILNIINTIPKQLKSRGRSSQLLSSEAIDHNNNYNAFVRSNRNDSTVIKQFRIVQQNKNSKQLPQNQNNDFLKSSDGTNKIKLSQSLSNFRSKSLHKLMGSDNSGVNARNSSTSQLGRKSVLLSINQPKLSINPLIFNRVNQTNSTILQQKYRQSKIIPNEHVCKQTNNQQINKQYNSNRSSHHRQAFTPPLSRQKLRKKQNAKLQLDPLKSIPAQIQQYLEKRKDVQIVKYFEEYKKQLYTKSRILHDYIYSSEQPQKIKNTYLNESDGHFRNGLEAVMLKLFRSGVIVPNSYDNLRQQAVEQIEKWIIGWIHRKIFYGKLSQDQDNQVLMVQDSIKHLEQYKKLIDSENTSF